MEEPSPAIPPLALAELLCLVLSEDDRITLKAVRRLRDLGQAKGSEREALEAMGATTLFGSARTPYELAVRAELSTIMASRRLDQLNALADESLKRVIRIDRKARIVFIVMFAAVCTSFLTGFGSGVLVERQAYKNAQFHEG